MYKNKKRNLLFGRSHSQEKKKREGVQTDETKTTIRVIACYCWKEDGHLFQSLLFGLFPCCCCRFLFIFFVCGFFLLGLCRFIWTARQVQDSLL